MIFQGSLISSLVSAIIVIVVILFSLSIHEFAHALVAHLFGDSTAKDHDRMTINPLKHWDQVGTTLLVGLIALNTFGLNLPVFGWGKPVPVDERNFTNPRWDGLQTALAGPFSNFLIALVLAGILRFFPLSDWLAKVLYLAISLNVFLMVFNLLPIPPLDGSRILRLIISDQLYFSLATNPIFFYTMFVVVIFFLINPLSFWAANITTLLAGY